MQINGRDESRYQMITANIEKHYNKATHTFSREK